MQELGGALYRIFVVTLLASLYRLLGGRGLQKKAPMLLVCVCVAAILLPPLLGGSLSIDTLFPDAPSTTDPEPESTWEQALIAQTRIELAESLCASLQAEFGLRADTVSVRVELVKRADGLSLSAVYVTLRAQDSYMREDVATYLGKQTQARVCVDTA